MNEIKYLRRVSGYRLRGRKRKGNMRTDYNMDEKNHRRIERVYGIDHRSPLKQAVADKPIGRRSLGKGGLQQEDRTCCNPRGNR